MIISCNFSIAQCPLDINEVSQAPTNNLLLHLPFDGNLNNLGSTTYSAILSGATFVPTQCGQGLSFDGVDDYVIVSPSMNLVNDFTVTAWINPNAQVDWMGIFSIREQCLSTYRGYSIAQFGLGDYNVATLSNQINIHQNCTGFSGGDRYTDPSILIPNGSETFIGLTVINNSSENRIVKLFVNCEEFNAVMTIDVSTSVCFSNALNYITTIGASSSIAGQTNTFDGIIDELRVYDVALNQEQILDVYQSCLPITLDVINFSDCSADSAEVTVYNSEIDVNYQLFDVTNSMFVGPIQPGNCSPLVFPTGLVNDTTEYQVQAINTVSNCIINLDSLITIYPSSNESFSNQTVDLCIGDSIQIGGQYVSSPGVYNDTIPISPFCDSIVSYNVTILPIPILDLGIDLTICSNETVTLNSNIANQTYLWQDGTTSDSLVINQAGVYWLEVSNTCGSVIDSIEIFTVIAPVVDLGNDTLICAGDFLLLTVNIPGSTITWQDGSSNDYFNVSQNGIYIVEVASSNCVTIDSIEVVVISAPLVNLGNDTIICLKKNLILSVAATNGNYVWSNGSTESSIIVNAGGIYSVVVANECGVSSDEIIVKEEDCYCELYVPNTFTPDGSKFNETFQPILDCPLESFNLKIFNRWGEVVFDVDSIELFWDATYNGVKVQNGTYAYKIEYKLEGEDVTIVTGHVNVLY